MFCYQCQETAHNKGCTVNGVCGKTGEVAILQDATLFMIRGISMITTKMRERGDKDIIGPNSVDRFVCNALFMTIPNANFNRVDFFKVITEAVKVRDKLLHTAENHGIKIKDILSGVTDRYVEYSLKWDGEDITELMNAADRIGVMRTKDEDIRSLRELVMYGIKGIAAYAEHAFNLNHEDNSIYSFMQSAMADLNRDLSTDELTRLVLATGENGVKVMDLLDRANTGRYGNPEITEVNLGVRGNPGILISGHDLRDLEDLLKQTEGTGVDVYTHSEMLPAHYYPEFKRYKHFAGNYGGAWWQQRTDFESFNGPILFTTNCIVPPLPSASYAKRVFTTGAAGFPGFPHIPHREEGKMKDFSQIIELAKSCDPPKEIETGKITGGFAHAQVEALVGKIADAVKSGAIRRFYVMSGCDGRMKNREYYTEFAKRLPKDTVILTSGCAKYRYNKLPLGDIGGIPRVLDAGQCNDSYSWAVIAFKLKEIFGIESVNDLPITFNIAWYEQKAVIVLLALLSLGFKDIHVGPTIPAFLSPNILNVLHGKFGLDGVIQI